MKRVVRGTGLMPLIGFLLFSLAVFPAHAWAAKAPGKKVGKKAKVFRTDQTVSVPAAPAPMRWDRKTAAKPEVSLPAAVPIFNPPRVEIPPKGFVPPSPSRGPGAPPVFNPPRVEVPPPSFRPPGSVVPPGLVRKAYLVQIKDLKRERKALAKSGATAGEIQAVNDQIRSLTRAYKEEAGPRGSEALVQALQPIKAEGTFEDSDSGKEGSAGGQ